MDPQNIITIENKEYYNAKDLKRVYKAWFYGTSKSIRLIINKQKIPSESYLYARYNKKSGWKVYTDQYNPDKRQTLLIEKSWAGENIPNVKEVDVKEVELKCAPDILLLRDEEKFRNNGKIVDIETRGHRDKDSIYFLCKDVSRVFEMPSLKGTLFNNDTLYEQGKHYITFICNSYKQEVHTVYSSPITIRKRLFITYEGLLKVLFSSRCGIAKEFKNWATKTLFTVQMGTPEKKKELIKTIMDGLPMDDAIGAINLDSSETSSIYCMTIGRESDLGDSSYPSNPNGIVIKYGYTKNLERRLKEHNRDFSNIKGSQLKLLKYCRIDKKYLSQAEVDLKEFLKIGKVFKYKNYAELIVIDEKQLGQIKKQFNYIRHEYQGKVDGFIKELEELERKYQAEIKDLKHQAEIKDLKHRDEIKDKDIQIKDEKLKHQDELIKILTERR